MTKSVVVTGNRPTRARVPLTESGDLLGGCVPVLSGTRPPSDPPNCWR